MARIRLHRNEAAGRLPPLCMRCGRPAFQFESLQISWFPPWVNALMLLGVIPYLVVAPLLTRRATLLAPFCPRHRHHWHARQIAIGLAALAFALGVGGSLAWHPPAFLWVLVVLFPLLVATVIVVHRTSVRAVEVTEAFVVIDGVCDEFLDAMSQSESFSLRPGGDSPPPKAVGSDAIQRSAPVLPPPDSIES